MTTLSVHPDRVVELSGRVAGVVLQPGDGASYEREVAAFNVVVTHRPVVVVGAANAADVAAAVTWAAEAGLPVAVHATGHGSTVPVEDALMITTGRMADVEIDPGARTARIGAGCRWKQVIEAAAPHGLAPLNGSSSDVGAIGYTLGGGLPVLARTYGFSADHVRGLEIVTADGRVQWVDGDTAPDLFWALRGGQGNFGVVTSMVVDLVPMASFYGGAICYPGEYAATLLQAFREWARTLTERTSTSVALLRLPPMPIVPEPLRERFVLALRMAHVGTSEEGASIVAPMRAAAPILLDGIGEMPYTAVDMVHMDPPDPLPLWLRGMSLRDLTDEGIATLLEAAGPDSDTPSLMVEIRLLGGALRRQAEPPNAVSGREGTYTLLAVGVPMPDNAALIPPAGDALLEAMAKDGTGHNVLNFLSDFADGSAVEAAWDAVTYQRPAGREGRRGPAQHVPLRMRVASRGGGLSSWGVGTR